MLRVWFILSSLAFSHTVSDYIRRNWQSVRRKPRDSAASSTPNTLTNTTTITMTRTMTTTTTILNNATGATASNSTNTSRSPTANQTQLDV